MMNLSRLVNTYRMDAVSLIGNPDMQYAIRIELWQRNIDRLFFATVDRAFHCDLHVSSENATATELLWTVEETIGVEEQAFESEAQTLEHALAMIGEAYSLPDLK